MKKISLILFLSFFANILFAQDHRFQNDIETIKRYDRIYQALPNSILFTGSSSIRKWDGIQQKFGGLNVLNRGIGGAVIDDIIYFADDLIFKYKPRQVVLYVGENDLPDQAKTADTILKKTIKLFHLIRSRLPDVPIVYISLKPSPSREVYMAKCAEANRLIKDFIDKQEKAVFADVFSLMLDQGKARSELFVADRLHMKAAGYKIWEKAIEPYLLKTKGLVSE